MICVDQNDKRRTGIHELLTRTQLATTVLEELIGLIGLIGTYAYYLRKVLVYVQSTKSLLMNR